MEFTSDSPGLLEVAFPVVAAEFGFDAASAHAQAMRLALVGLHARFQPSLSGQRYRLMLPVFCAGEVCDLPLDSVYEVSVVLAHMCAAPVSAPSLPDFHVRAAGVVGLQWLGGL